MNVLEAIGVDALIVSGATNRRYFSGWSAEDHAPDRPHGVMLIASGLRALFASPTNLPWARAEVLDGVEAWPMSGPWTDVLASEIRSAATHASDSKMP